MSENYSPDMNGLLKAIQDNGGMAKVDEAMKSLNSPIVKTGLKMLGIDTGDITEAYKQIKNVPLSQGNAPIQQKQQGNTNSYIERLNALKRK